MFSFFSVNPSFANTNVLADSSHKSMHFAHHLQTGLFIRLGQEDVYTHNDLDNKTVKDRTYLVGERSMFVLLRYGFGAPFKKHIEAGFTTGADVYFQINDNRVLVPLLPYLQYKIPLHKKVDLNFKESLGYSFYIRNRNKEPQIIYKGIEGGFNTETNVGLNFIINRNFAFELLLGYRMQHLRSKYIYNANNGGYNTGLPDKITMVSNGFYHFLSAAIGFNF